MRTRAFSPPAGPTTLHRARGFTIVELIVTMAVVGILVSIAVPSFRSFLQNSRLANQANTLVYSLNLARSEAIRLDTPIEVCASSDGATCNIAATPPGWADGWIVCYPAANCAPGGAGPFTLLQVSPALGGGNTVTEQIAGALAVTYLTSGQTNTGKAGSNYRFVFCDNRGAAFGQDVEISFIGRIESAQTQGQTVSGAALAGC
jgi:type IV fimbrial biogenesis protein FimT